MPTRIARESVRRVRLLAAGSAAALLAAALMAAWGARTARTATAASEAAHTLIEQMGRVRSEALISQVAYRSFLLSGDSVMLTSMRGSHARVDSQVRRLDSLVSHDTALVRVAQSLGNTLRRAALLRERVVATRRLGLDSALRQLSSPEAQAQGRSAARDIESLERSAVARRDRQRAAGLVASSRLVALLVAALLLTALMGALGVAELVRDTTALSESEARYRALSDDNPDGVLVHAAGRVVYANAALAEIQRAESADAMIGRRFLDLIHEDDRETVAARMQALAATTAANTPRITRIRRDDGAVVEVEARSREIDYEGERAVQVMVRDISERRALEEAVQRSERMEALGRMANGVAHDVNNMLTIVRTAAELLHEGGSDAATRESYRQRIATAVDRAAALTTQLLAFSRRRHAIAVAQPSGGLFRQLQPMLQRLVGPERKVHLHVAPVVEQTTVVADRAQFEQVLFNVLVNARDATPPLASIVVRADTLALARSLRHQHATVPAGEYLRVTVQDSGVGMDEATLAQLFVPFFTTKAQGEGAGLGLAAAYGIVQAAGGAITVESAVGAGTTVTVYWPTSTASAPLAPVAVAEGGTGTGPPVAGPHVNRITGPDAAPVSASPVSPPAATPGGAATVLVVDDEDAIQVVVERILERAGFTVLTAASGSEALALAREHADALAAVVTDVRMPGMSGVELAQQLLAASIDRPVLFISGQLDDQLPTEWASVHPHAFLGKPFAPQALVDEVRRLLAPAARPGPDAAARPA